MDDLGSYFLSAKSAKDCGNLDSFLSNLNLPKSEKDRLRSMINVESIDPKNDLTHSSKITFPGIYSSYLQHLDHEGWNAETIDSVDDTVRKTYKKMDLRRPNNRPGYGLIIGRIQSGKTAHMIGTALHGLDNEEMERPFDIIIILSGLINDLRLQTRTRLISAISKYHSQKPLVIPDVNTDLSLVDKDLLDTLKKQLVDPQSKPVIVIKKNHIVLGHLLSCLPSVSSSNQKVLIIDDEADHASVDTGRDEQIENLGDHLIDNPSETNKLLRQVIKRFYSSIECWYIGYTATPFANLLSLPGMSDSGDEHGPTLHPRDMLQVLPKANDHLDNENYFLVANSPFIEIIKPKEEYSSEEKVELTWFIFRHIATQKIKELRGINKHHTSLIHSSINVDVHRREAALVRDIIDNRKHPSHMDSNLEIISEILSEYKLNAKENEKVSLYFKKIVEKEPETLARILGEIEVIEVNSRPREPGEESPRDLDYSAKTPRSYIAIGGTRLSRGLTLEGLTNSKFTRRANEPKYDTMLQQSRWCGYRSYNDKKTGLRYDYSDIIKIFTTDDIRLDFIRITNEEIDLRTKIGSLPEDANPLEHEIWIREHPGMKITRPEAMADAISIPWGNQIKTTIWSWNSPVLDKKNTNVYIDLFDSAKKLVEESIIWHGPVTKPNQDSENFQLIRGVDGQFVKQFLQSYHSMLNLGSGTEKSLNGLIREWDNHNFNNWNIAVHMPEKDNKYSISNLNIGLVNRSSIDGKIGYIQNSGLDTRIDMDKEQYQRHNPLILLYFIDPSSTFNDEGLERVFSMNVNLPVPIFGICLPTNQVEGGGMAWTSDKTNI